jgi:hypothetical protein
MMGLAPSPYVCTKSIHLADEMVNGFRHDPMNPMRWDSVHLNLPGSPAYDPQKPWVSRRRSDGKIASGVPTYVDDMRPVGSSKEECWEVAHAKASRYGYLGIQVSSRKTRPPSQSPGAWAGTIAKTGPTGVGVACSQEKWDKGKHFLQCLREEIGASGRLSYKGLEQKRGFFVHLQRTYPCLTPFLKGFHLTLDSWRPNRDAEGWKISHPPEDSGFWDDKQDHWVHSGQQTLSHPDYVSPVPRLMDDLLSLQSLMSSSSPPFRIIRSRSIAVAVYGFVDASSIGFGSTLILPDGCTAFRHGCWGRDTDDESSNFKELSNLVTTIEEGVASGELVGTELFIFTDNSTAKGAFYKGNSSNRLLFTLILRLRSIEMGGQLRLHVVHVAGTRMISQGTDGLSRGDYTTGVMAGIPMLNFIPLHLDAIARSPTLLTWAQSWVPLCDIAPLTPEDWFEAGHGLAGGAYRADGMWEPHLSRQQWFLWTPPPAAASAAIDELSTSRQKRPHLNHVFICPRLLTSMWRKKLFKVSDIVLELPAGCHPAWPSTMHEPLLIGLTLCFIRHPPWQLRNSAAVLDLGREVHRVWKTPAGDVRPFLCQLCDLPSVLDSMPERLVRGMLYPSPPGQVSSVHSH